MWWGNEAGGRTRRVRQAALRPVLWWRSRRRLRTLGLPSSFTFTELHQRLQDHLGRKIFFATVRLPPQAPSGIVLTLGGTVIVIADARTSRLHRWHIWAHELAHLVWGHVGADHPAAADALRRLFPQIPESDLDLLLTRTTCTDSSEEAAAEMLAALTMQRLSSWQLSLDSQHVPSEARQLLRHLATTLG